ncbi:MAG: ABC transporter permease subunit [Candidatus Latescibacterota bacterium]
MIWHIARKEFLLNVVTLRFAAAVAVSTVVSLAGAFVLHSPENLSRANPLLWRFRRLDWAFIVMVVLSFTALVLSYDAVCGEREAQTLRLQMSQAVHRRTLILGKLAGVLLCLLLLLLVGVLLHLTIVSLAGVVALDARLAVAVAGALLLSALYLSVFVPLGLFVSSRCRQSATSLVICLLAWALLVVVVPNLGGLLASSAGKLSGPQEVWQRADAAWDEARQRYDQQHPSPMAWVYSGNWSPGEPLHRAVLMDEAKERVYLDWITRMLTQARTGRDLTRIAPAAVYRHGMEALAGSGLEHFARFLEQARRYRQELRDFLQRKYPLDPDAPFSSEANRQANAIPVAFEEIPRFQERLPGPAEAARDAAPDALLLALWVTVACSGACASFLRADVR